MDKEALVKRTEAWSSHGLLVAGCGTLSHGPGPCSSCFARHLQCASRGHRTFPVTFRPKL